MATDSALKALDRIARNAHLQERLPSCVVAARSDQLLFFQGDVIADERLLEDLVQALQGRELSALVIGLYTQDGRLAQWFIPAESVERSLLLQELRKQWTENWPSYCNGHLFVTDEASQWFIYFDPLEDFGTVVLRPPELGAAEDQVRELRRKRCCSVDEARSHVEGAALFMQLSDLQPEFLRQLVESHAGKNSRGTSAAR